MKTKYLAGICKTWHPQGLSKKKFAFVFFVVLTPFSDALASSSCLDEIKTGESLIDQGKLREAKTKLEKAIESCKKQSVKPLRGHIALGKAYNDLRQFNEAIQQFNQALKIDPAEPLALMNLSASHEGLGNHEKAIEFGKQAIANSKSNDRIRGQANFNVGLSLFRIAAEKDDLKDVRSEPYFSQAKVLLPDFGQSYFFLGTIQEVMHQNLAEAGLLFKKGCELKHRESCTGLQRVSRASQRQMPLKSESKSEPAPKPKVEGMEPAPQREVEQKPLPMERSVARFPVPPGEEADYQKYLSLLEQKRSMKGADGVEFANRFWKKLEKRKGNERKLYIDQGMKVLMGE